mgnify:CR=1 FL=1
MNFNKKGFCYNCGKKLKKENSEKQWKNNMKTAIGREVWKHHTIESFVSTDVGYYADGKFCKLRCGYSYGLQKARLEGGE